MWGGGSIYMYTHTVAVLFLHPVDSIRATCSLRPQLSSRLLVLLYFGGRHPNIISFRFRSNYICGILGSKNLLLNSYGYVSF